MRVAQLFIEGSWTDGAAVESVVDKYHGTVAAELHCASSKQVSAAVATTAAGQRQRVLKPDERFDILARASQLLEQRRGQLVSDMVDESGFTVADAEGEVSRAVYTLRLCAEEATRLTGEMVPLDSAPGVTGRMGFTVRVPVGVVCAITPFNSPLNTVVHKVGPALAAGNSVVLKPAPQTPVSATSLVQTLLDAGLPPTHIALVHGHADIGAALLDDARFGFYTFTGSTHVGEIIQRSVGLRRTQLELGSMSSVIVCEDADIDAAVAKTVRAGYRKAGQVCTSVQRVYVHEAAAEPFTDALLAALAGRAAGDPRNPDTFIGPLISDDAAGRVEAHIVDAAGRGGSVLAGGTRDGRLVAPTVLADITPDMRVMREEVFGPVVALRRFSDLSDALAEADDTPYGLAAGVFTARLDAAYQAARTLNVGTVHINEASSSRVDLMPFGGVKRSGFGREGPRYAAREMTDERLVTLSFG